MKTKFIATTALGIAFIAVAAQINISIGIVPFSLQVFAITLIANIYPTKQTLVTILIYILVGILGIPVFAGFKGGLTTFQSPTLGFIIGFIPLSIFISSFKNKWLGSFIGYLSLYLIALPILKSIVYANSQTVLSYQTLVLSFWLPFIISDILALIISIKAGEKIRESINL